MSANKTKNLGFNIWLENEPVNFEEMNENFEKIDHFALCIESGVKTASYSGGSDTVANWRYKKYSDGTVEMSVKLNFTNLKCNGGSKSPYYSEASHVYFPFSLSEIYDVQMHLASNTIGWVSDITNKTVTDKVVFKVMGVDSENDYINKQVFINVKGVLA